MIQVLPFRSCLLKVSAVQNHEFYLQGVDYQVKKYIPGKTANVILQGRAGEKVIFSLHNNQGFSKASISGNDISSLTRGKKVSYTFPGAKKDLKYLDKLGDMVPAEVPQNPGKYLETCHFALDNNALEVRELARSGNTKVPQVQACRDAFFNDTIFTGIGAWDRFAFDGDAGTSFKVRRYYYLGMKQNNGAFRLNLGAVARPDSLVFNGIPAGYQPGNIQTSDDLENWHTAAYKLSGSTLTIIPEPSLNFQYLRIHQAPAEVAEIEGFRNQQKLARDAWKASNLFAPPSSSQSAYCWQYSGNLKGIGQGAYLSVTAPGSCSDGGLFACLLVDGKIIAASDRAPSFPYNNWEHFGMYNQDFTFYIPLDTSLEGKKVEVLLISTDSKQQIQKPEVWLCNPGIYVKSELILN